MRLKKISFIVCLLFSGYCFSNSSDALIAKTPPNQRSEKDTKLNAQQELINSAKEARKNAYCPYSHYQVGAAVKTKNKKVYRGVNVENASYGMTICAERSAVFNAVTNGDKNIESIAIVTKDGGAPCGGCRQVLNEFNPDMTVIVSNEDATLIKVYTLKELLPHAFGPANLE